MKRLLQLQRRALAALSLLLLLLAGACVTVEVQPPIQQGDVAHNAEAAMRQLDSESVD